MIGISHVLPFLCLTFRFSSGPRREPSATTGCCMAALKRHTYSTMKRPSVPRLNRYLHLFLGHYNCPHFLCIQLFESDFIHFCCSLPMQPVIWSSPKVSNSNYAYNPGLDLINHTKRKSVYKTATGIFRHGCPCFRKSYNEVYCCILLLAQTPDRGHAGNLHSNQQPCQIPIPHIHGNRISFPMLSSYPGKDVLTRDQFSLTFLNL